MTVAAILFTTGSMNAMATHTGAEGGHDGRHHCIMFGAEKWQKLGLTEAQMNSVKEIQASCDADYKAAKNAGTDATASVDRHEQRLKSVLTEEQYAKWSEWCANKEHKKMEDHKTKSVQ
jgi:hypothetical protein